ncbi:helix-turn-helix domain-containing protein [Pseudomonas nitroreducens]|uniref:AlbA family DNA-binding domain-containing protein n=1 Tax=Pseudomonas nitroreducens TaxID=46680 RepID=UPI000B6B83E2|nr:ATP-binding protein [Pseudomonas nitroreducens]NMZ58161.1 ATP-binding protein [Pseudomonas nitroreducens]SNS12208.1 Putative DNA-binding domain-containing protein [Pseudomonas nitroreducens]
MLSDENLEQLRYKGESVDLDFKQAQYPFSGATDHQKSELLKDILAMANSYRTEPGHILIGFKDQTPHPAEVVGLTDSDHIDDATLQQFVHSKVAPNLEFQYEERLFDGKHIAIITIPKQPRPFAPNKDYGKLKKNTVYVRRGSSTDEASITEIAKMAVLDAGSSKTAQVKLQIDTDKNTPLPDHLTLRFLRFETLPDYEENNWIDMGFGIKRQIPSITPVNSDYYRDCADYCSTRSRMALIRLSLSNRSDFSLREVKLEVSCAANQGQTIRMLRSDDLPDEPESKLNLIHGGIQAVVNRMRQRVIIDQRSRDPICHIDLETLRPGETGRAETDIAVLFSGPGDYLIKFRILANEISAPITQEHTITVTGTTEELSFNDLQEIIYGEGTQIESPTQ